MSAIEKRITWDSEPQWWWWKVKNEKKKYYIGRRARTSLKRNCEHWRTRSMSVCCCCITNYHQPWGLDNARWLSPVSIGQKFGHGFTEDPAQGLKVAAGLLSHLEARLGEDPLPCFVKLLVGCISCSAEFMAESFFKASKGEAVCCSQCLISGKAESLFQRARWLKRDDPPFWWTLSID